MKIFYFLLLLFSFLAASPVEKNFYEKLSDAAITLTKDKVAYNPKYF
jgi:hypothetical protein